MTSAVLQIDSFTKKQILCFRRTLEYELGTCGGHNPVLYGLELKFQNLPQMVFLQRAEDDDLVDPIHELGRKLATSSLDRGSIDFLINLGIAVIFRPLARSKADSSGYQF